MTSTSLAFQVNGNTSSLLANSTTVTQITIQPSGQTPGAFYVYNFDDQAVFVNISQSSTANVVIADGADSGRGFPVFRYAPVLVDLHQQFNGDIGNIYVTAQTVAGTATVYLTPIA
jgi:hypothetical protein